jgi:hypothetical protein
LAGESIRIGIDQLYLGIDMSTVLSEELSTTPVSLASSVSRQATRRNRQESRARIMGFS